MKKPKAYRAAHNVAEKTSRPVYAADFETTEDVIDSFGNVAARVWHWGIADIDDPDNSFEWGIDIESFVARVARYNAVWNFHNLKFDAMFIVYKLLKWGYAHVATDRDGLRVGTFTTLISDMNKWFSVKIRWMNGVITEIRDSLKKFPNMSIEAIAETFKMEIRKGKIDYNKHRPVGYQPTPEEIDYLYNDVVILANAIKQARDLGMKALTVARDTLNEYKSLLGGDKAFRKWFPELPEYMDSEIRRAYRGGWTYVPKRFQGKRLGKGIVLDVNSLYPSVMYTKVLPYHAPEFADGYCVPDELYPLTIHSITFTAKLKENYLPCIQIKGSSIFGATEYLELIDEPTTLMVTNVDWELYQDHYDIEVMSYNGTWRFKGQTGMFQEYIDKWSAIKVSSEGGMRHIAKAYLNSLYGKFASNPNVTGKIPTLENDAVKLKRGPDESTAPVYTAMGVFITSWARDITVRAAQANYDVFAYADTDSLHLLIDTPPETIEIHPSKMGAWKQEYAFTEAVYVRPKSYIEMKTNGKSIVRWAGLPDHVSQLLTFEDVKKTLVITPEWMLERTNGQTENVRLQPENVPGGVVLKNHTYTFKM